MHGWLSHLFWFVTFGTLLSDAAKFLTAPFRGAEELVTNVWHAVRALFLKLRDVFGHVWDAFNDFYTGIVAFGRGAIHFAQNVVHAIGWLVETAIPSAANWAWRKARDFAKVAVADLRKWATAAVAWLRRHLERLIAAVEKLARWFYRKLLGLVQGALHWIRSYGTKLYNLVMHPDRLVTWILPYLVVPMLKFMVRHSAPIVKLMWGLARKDAVWLAHQAEDVLSKLL